MPHPTFNGLFGTFVFFFLPVFLLLSALLLAMRRFYPDVFQRLKTDTVKSSTLTGIALLGSAGYLFAAAMSLAFPAFIDPVELQIASVSWLSIHGSPIYHSSDAAVRYSLVYGPFCYLPFMGAMSLFGGSIAVLKCTVLLGNVLLGAFIWSIYRSLLPPIQCWLASTLTLLALLSKADYVFQVRGDIFLIIASAASLCAAVAIRGKGRAATLFTLAIALGLGAKITAIFYFSVPLLLIRRRLGDRIALSAFLVGALLSFLPFATSTASLTNFLFWLHEASLHPKSLKELMANVLVSVFLLLPVLLGLVPIRFSGGSRTRFNREVWISIVFLCSVLAIDIIASKFGAGRHHLMPFVIISGYLTARLYTAQNRHDAAPDQENRTGTLYQAIGWSAIVIFVGVTALDEVNDIVVLATNNRRNVVAIKLDLGVIIQRYGARNVQMGFGSQTLSLDRGAPYPVTFLAPLLTFAGAPLMLDPSALADMQLSGLNVPSTTDDVVLACKTKLWLIPKKQIPFSASSIYSTMYGRSFANQPLVDSAFRQAFEKTYHKVGETQFFDLYECSNT
jgi:hypothetical protein